MFLKTCFNLLRELLFDVRCVHCNTEGSILHDSCISQLPSAPHHRLSWITSMWWYQNPSTKKIIKTIKKYPRADFVYRCISQLNIPKPPNKRTLVVPIPASPERIKQYGFNQAEVVAKAYAQLHSNFVFCNILDHTIIYRKKQALITDRNERLNNKRGSYCVKETYRINIKDMDIVLIDDVSTTGATLIEARKVLLHHGAKQVTAWTIAH